MAIGDNLRNGGRILIDQLVIHGVDRVYCVPGESYLAALDAFADVEDKIQLITCRHEAAACNMAEAHGKLTGRPGVCFVTRAPGACHGVIGMHTAHQDSSPLVVFVGQIARDMTEREAFQEMDYRRFFDQATKWTAEINAIERIPELVSQAFHTAMAGRPGPVALALPEDMLMDQGAVSDAAAYHVIRPAPRPEDMARLHDMLGTAEKPLLLVGGGGWSDPAVSDVAAFAEAYNLPVSCAFRNQDRFNNHHDNYIGELGIGPNPKLLQRIKDSDLLIVMGPRMGEMTSQGYSLIGIPLPAQTIVHIHADAEELGRVFRPTLAINAGMAEFAAAARALPPLGDVPWAAQVRQGRQDYLAWQEIVPTQGDLDMAHVMAVLRARLDEDAIIANDAGNAAGWGHRYLPFTKFPSQLGPTSGAMGYGVPAAIAGALTFPDRQVIGIIGDGGFLMSGFEIITALQYGAKPIILIVNNNMYGTIRMHQERTFPGRYPGTALNNPDFAALARSFGAFGEQVLRDADFEPAFDRALASGKLAVLELLTDPEAITPLTTLSAIREAALQRQG